MTIQRITTVYLALMGLAFCKTGIEALLDPQAVMTQVGIVLDNASATSSMRAVYGGMHLVFGLFCFYGMFRNQAGALLLLTLYTTGFAIGRTSAIIVDGLPNEFVLTWLATEVICGVVAVALLLRSKPAVAPAAVGA